VFYYFQKDFQFSMAAWSSRQCTSFAIYHDIFYSSASIVALQSAARPGVHVP